MMPFSCRLNLLLRSSASVLCMSSEIMINTWEKIKYSGDVLAVLIFVIYKRVWLRWIMFILFSAWRWRNIKNQILSFIQEGEGHDILGQGQGEGKQISLPLQGWVTSFPNSNIKFPPPSPPLLISDKSLKGFIDCSNCKIHSQRVQECKVRNCSWL